MDLLSLGSLLLSLSMSSLKDLASESRKSLTVSAKLKRFRVPAMSTDAAAMAQGCLLL